MPEWIGRRRSAKIAWLLAVRHHSPFHARRHLAVVRNVSWSMLPWEADMLACTKAGYLSEIEIKISLGDWKSDHEKAKFRTSYRQWNMLKHFWYAGPKDLMVRYPEIIIPPTAGIIAVDDDGIEIIRRAEANPSAKPLTDKERLGLCRLGAIKAWNQEWHPGSDDEPTDVECRGCGLVYTIAAGGDGPSTCGNCGVNL